ncbi:hypothetical protein TcCL_ESM09716 [Trypanosoma cruzi]|nr:hypothetical protein TcCL_ESM09716 [Trypanosoma cruzi]
MRPSRVCGWECCPPFPRNIAGCRQRGVDHLSVRTAGSGYKMVQKRTQYAAGTRGQARQGVADGESSAHGVKSKSISQSPGGERKHKCADRSGDRSTCDSDSVTDERSACCQG